jgi:hypothetical protein
MPGSAVPVIKQVWDASDAVPFWAWARFEGHHLFDTANDPAENENRIGSADEARMAEMLRVALNDVEAPAEQFARLGLE